MNAPCTVAPLSGTYRRAQDAWTAFWQESGQSRCTAGAPDIWQALTQHWSAFAGSLALGARVLDLGCGAGAVAQMLLMMRPDTHVTGIDFARIPLVLRAHVELLSDTAMESLPFADASFAAVVSQFGFEYSRRDQAAREMARVLAPGARFSLLVHHADSPIAATNRERLDALAALLGPKMCTAFCTGDAAGLNATLAALARMHPQDALVAEMVRSLPLRLGRAQRERVAIWTAIEDALAPERYLSEALQACCVGAANLDDWLAPLRRLCEVKSVTVLRAGNGDPIAWQIGGSRSHEAA
jgi:ubiquinone/menaquinone biosynthesis C-methylase UbiE